MGNGNHNVIMFWGFLASRLTKEEKDWLNDGITIL